MNKLKEFDKKMMAKAIENEKDILGDVVPMPLGLIRSAAWASAPLIFAITLPNTLILIIVKVLLIFWISQAPIRWSLRPIFVTPYYFPFVVESMICVSLITISFKYHIAWLGAIFSIILFICYRAIRNDIDTRLASRSQSQSSTEDNAHSGQNLPEETSVNEIDVVGSQIPTNTTSVKLKSEEIAVPGDLIEHKSFGIGRIITINNDEILVEFRGHDKRMLSSKFAPMRKVPKKNYI